MSIADIFESGERKRQKGHFRNLVILANADGVVTAEEEKLLYDIGTKIGLTKSQIEEIKNNPEKYPINPPVNREERITRLVELIEMVCVDDQINVREYDLVKRFGLAIGCREEKRIEDIFRTAIKGFENNLDVSEIVDRILGG